MPVIGEVARGCDVGLPAHGRHKLIWHACTSCGAERWVALVKGAPLRERCQPCGAAAANKARTNQPDAEGRLTCTGCGEAKATTEFTRKKGGGVRNPCRACMTQRSRAWRAANPDRNRDNRRAYERARPEVQRASTLKSRYGITAADFQRMEESQGGGCAICRRPPARGRLHVDHCHSTGQVRGLLCGPCNRMIGLAKDDPATLMSAASYLTPEAQKAAA